MPHLFMQRVTEYSRFGPEQWNLFVGAGTVWPVSPLSPSNSGENGRVVAQTAGVVLEKNGP